jgi:ATP-binding cassette subfamily F protein 3
MQAALPQATGTQVRAQLARFGLAGGRRRRRSKCSGGEKARLLLALCTRDAPNLLILDEPTNHLDIDAREALVKALAAFEGAVLLITHDPHLVELVADTLWLVGDGTVRAFDGDLDEYRALLAERARAASRGGAGPGASPVNAPGAERGSDRRDRAENRARQAPLRQRLKEVEKLLERLGLEAKLIEQRLADPATYAKRKAEDIAWATTRRAAIAREVAALEEEWLMLSEGLDAA